MTENTLPLYRAKATRNQGSGFVVVRVRRLHVASCSRSRAQAVSGAAGGLFAGPYGVGHERAYRFCFITLNANNLVLKYSYSAIKY